MAPSGRPKAREKPAPLAAWGRPGHPARRGCSALLPARLWARAASRSSARLPGRLGQPRRFHRVCASISAARGLSGRGAKRGGGAPGRLFARLRRARRAALGLRSGRLAPLRPRQEPPRRPSAGAAAAAAAPLPAQPAGPARGWGGSGLGLRGEVRASGCPPRRLLPASFSAPSPALLPGRRSPKCARPAFLPRETFGSPRPLPFPRVKPTGPRCQSGGP